MESEEDLHLSKHVKRTCQRSFLLGPLVSHVESQQGLFKIQHEDGGPLGFGEHPGKDECCHLDLYHGPHPFPLPCHLALTLPKIQEGGPREEVAGLQESAVWGGERKLALTYSLARFAGGDLSLPRAQGPTPRWDCLPFGPSTQAQICIHSYVS